LVSYLLTRVYEELSFFLVLSLLYETYVSRSCTSMMRTTVDFLLALKQRDHQSMVLIISVCVRSVPAPRAMQLSRCPGPGALGTGC